MAAAWTGPYSAFIRDQVWGLQPVANHRLAEIYSGLELLLKLEPFILKELILIIDPGLGSYIISGRFRDRALARGLGLLGLI